MTARNFLIRGLIAGLIAGFAAFGVSYFVGEPQVQAAIDLEEAGSAEVPTRDLAGADATHPHDDGEEAAHSHDDGEEAAHSHEEGGTVVSRHNQRTWGLLTGTLGVGLALGGLVGLIAAGVVGRLGFLTPGQSTALVTAVGFVCVALVPFIKYPASPPAVGNGETIGSRTSLYFLYLVICLAVGIASVVLANSLWRDRGAYVAVMAGVSLFLLVTVVSGVLLPTVNELGDFPADVLWYFRRASLITQATMWATIGVALIGLTQPLYQRELAAADRRAMAANL